MKPRMYRLLCFLVFIFTICTTAPAQTPENNWTMIGFSKSCVKKTSNGLDQIKVFSWSDGQYHTATHFEAGKAYLINSSIVTDPMVLCDESSPMYETSDVEVNAGWSMITNPFGNMRFSTFFGDDEKYITEIYSFENGVFQKKTMNQGMRMNQGYWVYSSSNLKVQGKTNWETVKLVEAGEQYNHTFDYMLPLHGYPGDRKQLALIAFATNEITEKDEIKDVTDFYEIRMDSTDVASLTEDNEVEFHKAGTAVFRIAPPGASDEEWETATRFYTSVYRADFSQCSYLRILPTPEAVPGSTCDKGFLTNLDNSSSYYIGNSDLDIEEINGAVTFIEPENARFKVLCRQNEYVIDSGEPEYLDVTDSVTWDKQEYVTLEESDEYGYVVRLDAPQEDGNAPEYTAHLLSLTEKFKVNELGDFDIFAQLTGYDARRFSRNLLGVTIRQDPKRDANMQYFAIEDENLGLELNSSLSLTCFNGEETTTRDYILDGYQYYSSNQGAVSIFQNGDITANTKGYAEVFVSAMGVKSNRIGIRVLDTEDDPVKLVVSPSGRIGGITGTEMDVQVTGYMLRKDVDCSTSSQSGFDCFFEPVDVTDKVSWSYSYRKKVSVENRKILLKEEGTDWIVATMGEAESERTHIASASGEWFLIRVYGPQLRVATYFDGRMGPYYARIEEPTQFEVREAGWYSGYYFQAITDMAKWEVSDPSIATISDKGVLTGHKRGIVWIRAYVGNARSDKVWVLIPDNNNRSKFLYIVPNVRRTFKMLKPVEVNERVEFFSYLITANPTPCSYTSSKTTSMIPSCFPTFRFTNYETTSMSEWHSTNSDAGKFNLYNRYTFTGLSPGFTDVYATYIGHTSNQIGLEVWEPSTMHYCNDETPNSAEWEDDDTKAVLETDCSIYTQDEDVDIRYTAYLSSRGLMDNCLDLYILDEDGNKIRTLREEYCVNEPLTKNLAKEKSFLGFQYKTTWDMKNEAGETVPPGLYYATARFFIIWDPVINLPFRVVGDK